MSNFSNSVFPARRTHQSVQSVQSAHSISSKRSSVSSKSHTKARRRPVDGDDAYLYAIRVAYLHHLLQPRQKRIRHVPAPVVARSTNSVQDLITEFTGTRSNRIPHALPAELEKEVIKIIQGKGRPEYEDKAVKHSFGAFYLQLTEPRFRKNVEASRRAEELILIFYSKATAEIGKDKSRNDVALKELANRHVTLFVRLLRQILREGGWANDKKVELAKSLESLENKLLTNDRNLVDATSISRTLTVEEEIPRSSEVKDMAMVQHVARAFGMPIIQVQADLNQHKSTWTDKAALADLKTYSSYLNQHTAFTLGPDDFDLDEAYERWKKAEVTDVSQMMMEILDKHPELARNGTHDLPSYQPTANGVPNLPSSPTVSNINGISGSDPPFFFDQPVDMSGLQLNHNGFDAPEENPYVYIPSDVRSFFRVILFKLYSEDIRNTRDASGTQSDSAGPSFLTAASLDYLAELCRRWRVPPSTRLITILDIARENYLDSNIDLDSLDAVFNYVKEASPATVKFKDFSLVCNDPDVVFDRAAWPVADFATNRQILCSLHDALQRDLYAAFEKSYEIEPPDITPLLYVLTTHIREDPLFTQPEEEYAAFVTSINNSLQQQAVALYRNLLENEVPRDQEEWNLFHVLHLAESVVSVCQRVKKRWKKKVVLGVNRSLQLTQTILPSFCSDAQDIMGRLWEASMLQNEKMSVEDGFELYKVFREIRGSIKDSFEDPTAVHFPVESLMSAFVWRWIELQDAKIAGLIDESVKQDTFSIRVGDENAAPDEARHSESIINLFRICNQMLEPVVSLDWQDEQQKAQFLTGFAKVMGKGVAHYCEIVDGIFSKEMDRVPVQQEAATTRTQKDRLLALAKETWQNKEKVEPFNFYPESFVKLNNIEYAMLQWDQIEKRLDAESCAAVIAKYTPTRRRRPKVENYVFTVKIVEAEDLKACDVSGLSDPYVILVDEFQNRLAKTRVVYQNLNPRWDESVDISTRGVLNVVATVWDWDTLGDHDCCGRTTIKLDPAHFGDFAPREFWQELDTQGRILLRVSMEGETDDIQFHFAKAFRTIKRTEREMTRKITDKLSAFIHHVLSRSALRSLTQKGLSINAMSNMFRGTLKRQSTFPPLAQQAPTDIEVFQVLEPLLLYMNSNFEIMARTLTQTALTMVMTRIWKDVLATLEDLLVPPLSDKASTQKPLSQQELDIVFKWLQRLFEFFHMVDHDTNQKIGEGVPLDVLKSNRYHELTSLGYFYFETTDSLVRTSERLSSEKSDHQRKLAARHSSPGGLMMPTMSGGGSSFGYKHPTRRTKSIMLSRNLGTMRKAKEEKRRETQAEPNDDMIMRILRMRPEAATYLRDRARQRQKQAAADAAAAIVRHSMMQSAAARIAE